MKGWAAEYEEGLDALEVPTLDGTEKLKIPDAARLHFAESAFKLLHERLRTGEQTSMPVDGFKETIRSVIASRVNELKL
mgnify:CR=1 FL=1